MSGNITLDVRDGRVCVRSGGVVSCTTWGATMTWTSPDTLCVECPPKTHRKEASHDGLSVRPVCTCVACCREPTGNRPCPVYLELDGEIATVRAGGQASVSLEPGAPLAATLNIECGAMARVECTSDNEVLRVRAIVQPNGFVAVSSSRGLELHSSGPCKARVF